MPENTLSVRPPQRPPEPDAHGQAALMLAESTLLALIEANALTRAQALEAVEVAAEVKEEVAEETGESRQRMLHSLALLQRIRTSMGAMGAADDQK